jgi:hypothetical protein
MPTSLIPTFLFVHSYGIRGKVTDENTVLYWELLLYWDIGEEMKTCLEWNDAAVLKQIRKL